MERKCTCLTWRGKWANLDMFWLRKGNFIMINEFKYGQTWKIWPSPLSLSLYSTFKEFYPPITENLLKKALTFAEAHTHTHTHKHIFQMMTKQLFTTQGNHYFLTISTVGLRDTVGYSMSRSERTMERRFVS